LRGSIRFSQVAALMDTVGCQHGHLRPAIELALDLPNEGGLLVDLVLYLQLYYHRNIIKRSFKPSPFGWTGGDVRYSKEHGPAIRSKIIDAASVLFREHGMSVSIDDVMNNVGLTHGGFYKYFKSRQDLADKSIVQAIRQTNQRIRVWLRDAPSDEGLGAVVQSYLSPKHRDEIGTGCPLPALGAEIARMSLVARRDFSIELETMIGLLAGQYEGLSGQIARQRATAAIAAMVGSILLARVTRDPALSTSILAAGQQAVLDSGVRKARRRAAPSNE
jgi:TetR/AcrR family transcriptional repressor of nem operon